MNLYDLQVLYCVGLLSISFIGMKLVHDSLNTLADRYASRTVPTNAKTVIGKVTID